MRCLQLASRSVIFAEALSMMVGKPHRSAPRHDALREADLLERSDPRGVEGAAKIIAVV